MMQTDNHISDERARAFVAELRSFEQDGDVSGLLRRFDDDARLERMDGRGERTDPERFWREYLARFDRVSTTFRNAVEGDGTVALEWVSDALLSSGREISYSGVTVLDLDPGSDTITSLRTYYDSAAFVPGPPARTPDRSDGDAADDTGNVGAEEFVGETTIEAAGRGEPPD